VIELVERIGLHGRLLLERLEKALRRLQVAAHAPHDAAGRIPRCEEAAHEVRLLLAELRQTVVVLGAEAGLPCRTKSVPLQSRLRIREATSRGGHGIERPDSGFFVCPATKRK
jgi:hypothetical protein